MKVTEAVRNRIIQLSGEKNITINKWANLAGMPPSSMKGILYGRSKNPTIRNIKILCDGIGITLGEFFSTPEFDNLEQEIE